MGSASLSTDSGPLGSLAIIPILFGAAFSLVLARQLSGRAYPGEEVRP